MTKSYLRGGGVACLGGETKGHTLLLSDALAGFVETIGHDCGHRGEVVRWAEPPGGEITLEEG